MRAPISLAGPETIINQRIESLSLLRDAPVRTSRGNPISETLCAEGHESFYNYVEWLGLGRDPRTVILSSMHHFYYDIDEMKLTKTVINLKELNLIRNLHSFIHSIYRILSPRSYLLGCFIDKNSKGTGNQFRKTARNYNPEINENSTLSRIPFLNMIYNFIDTRKNSDMTRKNVTAILENSGFKTIDMTEINGITYFCAQRTVSIGD